MIEGLKPYLAMKDSGVSWLGDVPEHWNVLPNRALFTEVKDRNHPDEEMLSVTITRGIVLQKALLAESSKKDGSNLDKSAYKLVEPHDVAYNKMRAWQGAIAVSDLRGIISPAYVVMRLRKRQHPRFFHYLYRTPQFASEAERWSYGITSDMWSLRPEHFRLIYSPLPPVPEQAAIVRFLDHADRRIRRYVRTKQKLIQLLEERKRGIIHRAVTRGLDPNVRLKPSGVEWLGDVPYHWDVVPVGGFCPYISYGFTNPMPATDEGPFMLTANDIGDGIIRYDTARHTSANAFDSLLTRKSRPKLDDILVTKDGTLGRVAVADGRPACINQSVALLRADNCRVDVHYISTALRAPLYQERMAFDAGGTTIKHIYITRLSKMKMALPPIQEQSRILAFLGDNASSSEGAITTAEREIALLREYRTCLIASLVTGKLDVREAAARLPEEVPQDGALDEPEDMPEDEGLADGDLEAADAA
jgi:type I restriction enzyme, S subunit